MTGKLSAAWVILTRGDRPDELATAVESIHQSSQTDPTSEVVVVVNGPDPGTDPVEIDGVQIVNLPENMGVPGGRNRGLAATDAEIVFFLDDDASVVSSDLQDHVVKQFETDTRLAVVSFRIVDEAGATARRHIPRPGSKSSDQAGDVVSFLGGACAIRRIAFDEVGGYLDELFYAHEELDLAWRLIDAGWSVRYAAGLVVEHPHTPIGRHDEGWRLTGRNRVIIARRNLPWPVAAAHVTAWLVLGLKRAPNRSCRRSYLAGWRSGWKHPIERNPVKWRTVWRLARLGRPPVI